MNIDNYYAKLSRRKAIQFAICSLVAPAVAFFGSSLRLPAEATGPGRPQEAGKLDFPAADILEPSELVALLGRTGEKPTVICVGFKSLYDTAHIQSALYMGPARQADGLAALDKWAQRAPRNKTVVLYCGCCPWNDCPNIRPAYAALKRMGFSKLKVVRINQNFAKDWVEKGLPTDKK